MSACWWTTVDSIDVPFIWLNLLARLTLEPQRDGWGAVWELEGLMDPGRSKCNVITGNFGLGIYIYIYLVA